MSATYGPRPQKRWWRRWQVLSAVTPGWISEAGKCRPRTSAKVRKRYHAFEGQLKGYDSRILVAQVPGGMLTNLESQLKQQNAADKLDSAGGNPRVREDLGFIRW